MPRRDIGQGAANERPAAGLLLGQMYGGLRATGMIDVVHDVVSRQDHLGLQIAQGNMQDRAARLELNLGAHVRGQRGGGKGDQSALGGDFLQAGRRLRLRFQGTEKRTLSGRTRNADGASVSNASSRLGGPDIATRKRRISRLITPQPTTPIDAVSPVEARCLAAKAALAAVRRALINEPSSKTSGRPVSTELRTMTAGGPLHSPLHVLGERGNPFDTGDGVAAPQEGGQRDDPVTRLVREAEKGRVGKAALTNGMWFRRPGARNQ